MSAFIRLYPKAWRERYGDELIALLEDRPARPLDIFDLLFGALDAHLHPRDLGLRPDERKGTPMSIRSISPVLLLLMGIAALVAGYSLVVSAISVLEPDPTRWEGWGAAGLTAASALILAGLALGLWRPVLGLLLGIAGTILAVAAAPWLWFIAIPVGLATAIPLVARRAPVKGQTQPA
jgi:hypothetical protein